MYEPEWKKIIQTIVKAVSKNPSPATLKEQRDNVMKLLIGCVGREEIFVELTDGIVKLMDSSTDENILIEVIKTASFFDNRAANGSGKDMIHIEAFLAKCMLIFYENKVKFKN